MANRMARRCYVGLLERKGKREDKYRCGRDARGNGKEARHAEREVKTMSHAVTSRLIELG